MADQKLSDLALLDFSNALGAVDFDMLITQFGVLWTLSGSVTE